MPVATCRTLPDVGDGAARAAGVADDATVAVVAHQLLSSLAIIAGNSAVLRDHWDDLGPVERQAMLDKIERHAVHAGSGLRGLVGGRPVIQGIP